MVSSSLNNTNFLLNANYAAPIGIYKNWKTENKFGQNTAVGSTREDIWTPGGTLSYLSSAETMNIVSSSANDKGTPTVGTGAHTLKIYGLDNNFNLINEEVTLDGTNNVLTTNSFLRIYRISVLTSGSNGFNEGTITTISSSSATLQAQIEIGLNQTKMSHYTVPNGYYALINTFHVGITKNDQAIVEAFARPFGGVFQLKRTVEIFQNTLVEQIIPSFVAPPKTDLVVKGTQVSGGTTVSVTASYDFFLVPESQVNL